MFFSPANVSRCKIVHVSHLPIYHPVCRAQPLTISRRSYQQPLNKVGRDPCPLMCCGGRDPRV
jgi:hypothetical protein